jgi:hypothetical protein
VACTRTAISARAWLVSATSPSIPAVLRPVLRCVTWRTLTSVLCQLRSISFCRSTAVAMSLSCTALKILLRSRRTSSSQRRQSTRSQASPSKAGNTGRGSSGPFTEMSKLILWFRHLLPFRFKGSPAHVSVLSDPSISSVSGQLCKDHPGGVPGPAAPVFLLPFSCRHSLFEHPFLPGNSAPLTVGLPHRLRIPAPEMRTHGTVSTFRTRETRTGPGALCTPGTAVLTGHAPSAAAACRLSTAGPCHPGDPTQPGV